MTFQQVHLMLSFSWTSFSYSMGFWVACFLGLLFPLAYPSAVTAITPLSVCLRSRVTILSNPSFSRSVTEYLRTGFIISDRGFRISHFMMSKLTSPHRRRFYVEFCSGELTLSASARLFQHLTFHIPLSSPVNVPFLLCLYMLVRYLYIVVELPEYHTMSIDPSLLKICYTGMCGGVQSQYGNRCTFTFQDIEETTCLFAL